MALRLGEPPDQPFLRGSVASLPNSTSIGAPTSSVVVNSLWFVSLVLSLGAALFGILAKQWCREYLKWYSPPEPAIDNVMLRQIRFEAWQRSNASSIIASVPALLEFALVLFLTGLTVFVWSLHPTVAIFVTSAIGVLLTLVSGLTLMDVFSRVSPYKSPTGWALFRAAQALHRCCHHIILHCPRGVQLPPTIAVDWRSRDMHYADYPTRSATRPVRRTLSLPDTEYAGYFLADAFQAMVLIRALLWVQQGSTETALYPAIIQGARDLGTRRALRRGIPNQVIGYRYTFFSVIPELWKSFADFQQTMVVLTPCKVRTQFPPTGRGRANSISRPYLTMLDLHSGPWGRSEGPVAMLQKWMKESGLAPVLREAVLHDLSLLVDGWSASPRLPQVSTTTISSYAKDAVAMLGLLRMVLATSSAHGVTQVRSDQDHCYQTLVRILDRLWVLDDSWQQGVTSAILSVLASTAEITIGAQDNTTEAETEGVSMQGSLSFHESLEIFIHIDDRKCQLRRRAAPATESQDCSNSPHSSSPSVTRTLPHERSICS